METVSVRYIVDDVRAAMSFYTEHLGFKVEMNPVPGFAMLARGPLRLLLNTPGAGGAGQATSDGQIPSPGGWNRLQIAVDDLASFHAALKAKHLRFKNQIVEGQGGKQVLLEDPSGNLVELFQPNVQKKIKPVPEGFHTVTPFLLADDVSRLLDFIQTAFDGQVVYVMKSADGIVRHATIKVGDSLLMASKGTDIYGKKPLMLHLYVADVDAIYAQALRAGGVSLREPVNEFYGDRTAAVRDEWDNEWWIATHVEDVEADELKRREEEVRLRRSEELPDQRD
jgi:uncharacterized glyoxalase superfamily protein PhnB/catechol 2,3-dioxygenase-like lactoylglutathione lyase family enzyme